MTIDVNDTIGELLRSVCPEVTPGPARVKKALKVGDAVMVSCFSGLGSGGPGRIKAITQKYDEDTGSPYPVIVLEDGHQFDADSGVAITAPTMYYIEDQYE